MGTVHNASKVLMGSTGSNIRDVSNRKGAISAGAAVRLKSDGTITTAKADGQTLGVSLGKDLSDTDKTAICRKGLRVPLQLTTGFNPTEGAAVTIDDITGLGKAAGAGVTAFNGVFSTGRVGGSGVNAGYAEDGVTTVGVAYIDFPGGL